jgi:general secretion pathway protein G
MSHGRTRGFTLIELMVVIVILGTLVALVGPNVFRHLKQSTRTAVEVQIGALRQAVDHYYLDRRTLPASLQDLTAPGADGEPWIRAVPPDPWGQAYEYRVVDAAAREYAISSAGPDRQPGSADDLLWTPSSGFARE